MQNRSVWFVWGSARVPRVGFGVAPKQSFLEATISDIGIAHKKFATAGHRRGHARRVRYPSGLVALLVFAPIVCFGQEASPTPSPGETAESESVVVSATRFDIPLDQSPASVSVISSEDLEQKQIERVSDALREVPGLSVVQTGVAGQLTSVFTRGLRSEHTQVLIDETGRRSSRHPVERRRRLLRYLSRVAPE